jgi:hypothetical protein
VFASASAVPVEGALRMPRDIAWEPTFDLIDDDPEAPCWTS